jgi:hypothetical protein
MKLLLILSVLFVAPAAFADHTTLDCELDRWDGKHRFSKSYEVDCWDTCSISETFGDRKLVARVSDGGKKLTLESSDYHQFSGAKRAVIEGIPALMSCYGGSMLMDSGTLSCKYCQID